MLAATVKTRPSDAPIRSGELPNRMSYLAIGEGPPLVVFPGLSRDAGPLTPEQIRREAGQYRSLAFLTGRTVLVFRRPQGMARGTTMPILAAVHAAALIAQFPESVDLLGISTGGAIALQLAVDHPALVRKLVIAGAASWLGADGRARLREYGDRISRGASGAWLLSGVLAGPVLRCPLALLLWFAEWRERQIDPSDMLATIDAECGFDVTARLAEITAPTLVIAGQRDRAFSPALFAATARGIRNSRLVLLENRGHIGAMLDPRFGREVAAFLQG